MLTAGQQERLAELFRLSLGAARVIDLAHGRRLAEQAGVPLLAVERFALSLGVVPRRYERNIGTLGVEGQRRLLGCSAAVVGLGGLGGHVVELLARLGVGRVAGLDGDTFDDGNLNRQLLATAENLGDSKAAAAAARVARVNPAVAFEAHAVPFEQAPPDVLAGRDAVFDCLDTIPARRELARRCAAAGVALVHGAIAGWCGQVAVVPPGSGLLERLFSGSGAGGLEQRLGCLPFTAAAAAGIMVAAAVPVLLGRPAAGRSVCFFDLQSGEWETVEL